MINTDQTIQCIAVEAQFALSVLSQAIDRGAPDEAPYLSLSYDEAQGLLLVIYELDRAMKAIVNGYDDLRINGSLKDQPQTETNPAH